MTDTHEPTPRNHAELGPYIETFVLAGELKEVMLKQHATASNEFFYICDPRTLHLVEVPMEIGSERLTGVVIHFLTHTDPETGLPNREASVTLEFADYTAYMSYGSEEHQEALHVDVFDHKTRDIVRSGPIPTQEISDVLSRVLRPYDDPRRSDYSNLTDSTQMDDVRMILNLNDLVMKSFVKHYLHDNHEIGITTENGHLRELSIDQPFGFEDGEALVLRITQEIAEYSLQIFHRDPYGSGEIPASEEEIEAFRDILIDVTSSLKNKISPVTTTLDVEDINQGLL